MVAYDAPLESALSQLSSGVSIALLRALWNKVANVGASLSLQDESSPPSPQSVV